MSGMFKYNCNLPSCIACFYKYGFSFRDLVEARYLANDL
ncbi:hypothetical protein B488_11580 [Liberibacter crescens BT-1]|uniref:Uncharacterized protein n=1 Tax=Liberibacter crescens (strain BT-1) TaxID=1215343 RepID=L0EWD1_LIBCB|nr:hypothetical protein B488_11580 [Liberibacter crescens BT-1]